MKSTASLIVAVAVLAMLQPLLAAGKKDAPRRDKLVAALQAVSPDALGGRLGLNIAMTLAPKLPVPAVAVRPVVATDRSSDQLGYESWKSARKS